MRVCHYFEWESQITGGHAQSVRNQRSILDDHGITYTTEPALDVDLLHLNNLGPKSIYYAKRAQRNGIPVLAHAHQTAEDFKESFVFSNVLSRPLRPYLTYAYDQADHLVCPSEHNRDVIEGYTDVPTTVISNGFDRDRLDGFADLRAEYLDRYDLEPPVVFNFGHVIMRKGLETFVETARRMPDLDFVWFGYLNPTGGTLDKYLQPRSTRQLVDQAPDNCQFTGYIEDPRGAFAAGDIFFFPTKNENEGMALLEAMSCEKPPVIRDIATYEWLDDEHNCLKADDGPAAERSFVAALERLRDDPDLRDSIGTNAATTSDQFTLDAVGEELVALYDRLV